MGIRDLHNNSRTKMAILPAAIGANATKTGIIIDRQGYGGVEFTASYGAITTTGTIETLVVFDGDVTGTMTSVADANLQGTEALASLLAGARSAGTGKEVTKRIGYVGIKRYTRVDAVSTGTTTAGIVGITALLHSPGIAPTANP